MSRSDVAGSPSIASGATTHLLAPAKNQLYSTRCPGPNLV